MQLWHVIFDWDDNDQAPEIFTFTTKTGALGKVKRLYAELRDKPVGELPPIKDPNLFCLDDHTWCWVVDSELGKTKGQVGLE